MKNIIEEISKGFIDEAVSSPRMLEDLAAMEKYMTESYDGRTFVELLQNADDADAKRLSVFDVGDTLIVANDGRSFDETDIMAICRSGSSSKQRGDSIGYRGVGFKSATSISTEIVIYSNNVFFTFSKAICAKTLFKSEDKVPTVRIPFLYDETNLDANVQEKLRSMKLDGFTTFFIFRDGRIDKFLSELKGFNPGWLLFLNDISEVNIAIKDYTNNCSLKRKKISNEDCLICVNGNMEQWYVVSRNNVSLAFKYDLVKGVIPCAVDEAVFHCFLPTIDKTGFPFKVNADFSTDPSRKHIIQDDITNHSIQSIQQLYAETVSRVVHESKEKCYSIISLLNTHTALNSLATFFENGLMAQLQTRMWVQLCNGKFVKPQEAKVFPKWLELNEKRALLDKTSELASTTVKLSFVEKVDKIETLLIKLGSTEVAIKDLADLFKNVDQIKLIAPELLGKIFVYINRAMHLDNEWMGYLFIPLQHGYVQLKNSSYGLDLDLKFGESIKNLLSVKELSSLVLNYDVFSILQQKKKIASLKKVQEQSNLNNISENDLKLAINKWKTPVQNCMALEALRGNNVKDAGKKCEEYDVISTDKEGNKKYISVKTVGALGDSFKLSEAEYNAAKHFETDYLVYLFSTETTNVEYATISNPTSKIEMEKVVKEWEWLCNSYIIEKIKSDNDEGEGESIPNYTVDEIASLDFDKMSGEEFEKYCAQLLVKNGYEDVSLTAITGDQGIDIIAYKDNIKYGIQCKCYSSDVGNDAVQEVFSGKSYYKCTVGIVITNQHFTPAAINLAENSGIVLWGRELLMKLIKNAR